LDITIEVKLGLRHQQPIRSAAGGDPSANPAPFLVEVSTSNRRRSQINSCRACGSDGAWFAVRHRLIAIQSLFTGTIAKVTSLVAIVIGGDGFASPGIR